MLCRKVLEQLCVVAQPFTAVLDVSNDTKFAAHRLRDPYGHAVVHTQIPPRFAVKPALDGYMSNATVSPRLRHLSAVVGARIRSVEGAVILLLDHVLGHARA